MNLPNKLTVLRVLMVPFFVAFMLYPLAGDASKYVALALFCIASFTDFLDGNIARKPCYKLWKVYGSACRQTFGLFSTYLPQFNG